MPRILSKTAGDCHCLTDRDLAPQFILSGARHLPQSQEIRLLEFLENHAYFGIVKHAYVRLGNQGLQSGNREAFRINTSGALQAEIAVRTDDQALVQLRRKREVEI